MTSSDGPAPTVPTSVPTGAEVLDRLARVLAAPLPETARGLSVLLGAHVGHSAIVLLTEDDVAQPRKSHGDAAVTAALTVGELEVVRASVAPTGPTRLQWDVAGRRRILLVAVARTGALLVVTDPASTTADDLVAAVWESVALRVQQFAAQASPAYLAESRAASSVRVEAVTDLVDRHGTTLESLLAVLRSADLDDRAARSAAVDLATTAAVALRTATDRVRAATEEPVSRAFERLRSDLRPLLRYRKVDVQFVEPPVDGRALPSEVAHGARAVVRGAILALVDQPNVTRVRVQWDCDGRNLLIDVRDDGRSGLDADGEQARPLRQRVLALNGELTISTTAGWGSEMTVVLPLDPPPTHGDEDTMWDLAPREAEVLQLMAHGLRNRAIAAELGISENTVKFHASKIFRKLGVTSRAEVAALVSRRLAPGAVL